MIFIFFFLEKNRLFRGNSLATRASRRTFSVSDRNYELFFCIGELKVKISKNR